MKVLLVCAAGMSTSMLMKKMEAYAKDNGIDLEIAARSFSDKKRNGEMPLHEFMSAFASLLADKEAVDTLLKRQNWETLMALLESALSGEPDGSPGT